MDVTENPLYHDTYKLLYKYRDVVWSLELSVNRFVSSFILNTESPLKTSWILYILQVQI